MIRFSIIIPVCNTPFNYYEECINSVQRCLSKTDEVVIVDDGSEEENYLQYYSYVKDNGQIKYIRNINNQGVSAARNKGIQEAQNEYLVFVDADDMLINNVLNSIREELDNNNPSLFIFGCARGRECSKDCEEDEYVNNSINISDIQELLKATLLYSKKYNSLMLNTVWGKAYRRESIISNNIRFSEKLRRMEDVLFNIEFLSLLNDPYVLYKKYVGYFYRTENMNSAVHTSPDESAERFRIALAEIDNKIGALHKYDLANAVRYKKFVILVDYIVTKIKDDRDLESKDIENVIKESTYKEVIKKLGCLDLLSFKEIPYLFCLKSKKYNLLIDYCKNKLERGLVY